jgi:hypothetical protein
VTRLAKIAGLAIEITQGSFRPFRARASQKGTSAWVRQLSNARAARNLALGFVVSKQKHRFVDFIFVGIRPARTICFARESPRAWIAEPDHGHRTYGVTALFQIQSGDLQWQKSEKPKGDIRARPAPT